MEPGLLPRPSSDAFRAFSLSTIASTSTTSSDVVEYEGLNQTSEWIFRGLVHSARCKVESEMELLKKNCFTFDKVLSFESLQPVSAVFDSQLIVYRDEFKFFLSHSDGDQWSCNVEAFILKAKDQKSGESSLDSLVLCYVENPGRSLMFPPFRKGHLVITDLDMECTSQNVKSIASISELTDKSPFIKFEDFNGSKITLGSTSAAQIRLWKTYFDQLFSSADEPLVLAAQLDSQAPSYHFGSCQEEILANPFQGLNIISPQPKRTHLDSYKAIESFKNELIFTESSFIDNPELKPFLISSASSQNFDEIDNNSNYQADNSCHESEDNSSCPPSDTESESEMSEQDYGMSGFRNNSSSTLSKFDGINYRLVSRSSPILAPLLQATDACSFSEDEFSVATPVLEETLEDSGDEYQVSEATVSLPSSPQFTAQRSSNLSSTDSVDVETDCTTPEHRQVTHKPSVETIVRIEESIASFEQSNESPVVDSAPAEKENAQVEDETPITPKPTISAPLVDAMPLHIEAPTLKKKRSTKKLFGAIKHFFKNKKGSETTQESQQTSSKTTSDTVSEINEDDEDDSGSQIPGVVLRSQNGISISFSERSDRCLSKISEEDVSFEEEERRENKLYSTHTIEEDSEEPESTGTNSNPSPIFSTIPKITPTTPTAATTEHHGKTILHSKSDASVRTFINVDLNQQPKFDKRSPNAPLVAECEARSCANYRQSISSSSSGQSFGTVSNSSSNSTLYERNSFNRPVRPITPLASRKMSRNETISIIATQAVISKWSGRRWEKIDNGFIMINVSVCSPGQGGLVECKHPGSENILTLKVTTATTIRRATFQDVEIQGAEVVASCGSNELFMFRFVNRNDADEFSSSIDACKKDFTSQVLMASKPSLIRMRSSELLSSGNSIGSSVRSDLCSGVSALNNKPRLLRSCSSASSIRSHRSSLNRNNASSIDSDRMSFTSFKTFTPTLLPPLLSNKNVKT